MRSVDHSGVSAAILAGGRAIRFGGRDKSHLVVDGRTIIVRQVDVLQQVADEVFVVGPNDGRFDDAGVAVYEDLVAGCGALGGLHTALESAQADRVLIVACDLPFLEVSVMARLAELAVGHDAAWIRGPRGPEPLVACYGRHLRPIIASRLANRQWRVGDLDQTLRIAWLEEVDLARLGAGPNLLANLNTADDYARVQYRPS